MFSAQFLASHFFFLNFGINLFTNVWGLNWSLPHHFLLLAGTSLMAILMDSSVQFVITYFLIIFHRKWHLISIISIIMVTLCLDNSVKNLRGHNYFSSKWVGVGECFLILWFPV